MDMFRENLSEILELFNQNLMCCGKLDPNLIYGRNRVEVSIQTKGCVNNLITFSFQIFFTKIHRDMPYYMRKQHIKFDM